MIKIENWLHSYIYRCIDYSRGCINAMHEESGAGSCEILIHGSRQAFIMHKNYKESNSVSCITSQKFYSYIWYMYTDQTS